MDPLLEKMLSVPEDPSGAQGVGLVYRVTLAAFPRGDAFRPRRRRRGNWRPRLNEISTRSKRRNAMSPILYAPELTSWRNKAMRTI
jgi:hypothetical protein